MIIFWLRLRSRGRCSRLDACHVDDDQLCRELGFIPLVH